MMITESEALHIAVAAVERYAARHLRPTHVTISQAAKMLGIGRGTAARLLGEQRNACGMVPIEAVDDARTSLAERKRAP
ncbi:MAG: DNA-binding protein [Chloroflexota bacterium]